MARKIERPKPSAAAASAAEELDILHPERTLVFASGRIVVREYGGVEWLRLQRTADPLIRALAGMLAAGEAPTFDAAAALVADHLDIMLPLIAQAADVDIARIDALAPDEVDLLLMTWWGANGRFFILRACNSVSVARAESKLATSAGASSTQPSSPTDTSAPTSDATPGVS